jgi:hypothetical protein
MSRLSLVEVPARQRTGRLSTRLSADWKWWSKKPLIGSGLSVSSGQRTVVK